MESCDAPKMVTFKPDNQYSHDLPRLSSHRQFSQFASGAGGVFRRPRKPQGC
jgi:hypothetical protein